MWNYRIISDDGRVGYDGYLHKDFFPGLRKLHGIAERGENLWEYEMYQPGKSGVVSFKRFVLGVRLEKVGFLRLPPLPGE